MSSLLWLRRVYDAPTRTDGYRVLVDRLWPRGTRRADAQLDEWCRDLAPSNELRRWFDHDPHRWAEFQRRYRVELADHRDAVDQLTERANTGRVTLVYGDRDPKHNNAAVLRDVIEEHRGRRPDDEWSPRTSHDDGTHDTDRRTLSRASPRARFGTHGSAVGGHDVSGHPMLTAPRRIVVGVAAVVVIALAVSGTLAVAVAHGLPVWVLAAGAFGGAVAGIWGGRLILTLVPQKSSPHPTASVVDLRSDGDRAG